MFTWFKNLLFDEGKFVGLLRAVLLGVGGAVATGNFPIESIPTWAGVVAMAAGGFVRSSTTSKPNGK